MKQKNKFILIKIINSFIAGILVLLGAFSTGNITEDGIFVAIVAGLIVFFSNIRDFLTTEEKEIKSKLGVLNFI